MAALEKTTENWLKNQFKKRRWLYLKLALYVGIPDRLAISKGPTITFIEVKKSDTGRKGPLQDKWMEWLTALGCMHEYVTCREEAEALLELLDSA